MECKALGMIREARALLDDELKIDSSRELSMTITKLDEAILWRQRDMQLKSTSVDLSNENGIILTSRDCIDLMKILSNASESCGAMVKIAEHLNRNK